MTSATILLIAASIAAVVLVVRAIVAYLTLD